jgi:DNA ligase-4
VTSFRLGEGVIDITFLLAYDLKLIIEKDQLDVIKPSWITDSIDAEEAVPLRKKYFVSFIILQHAAIINEIHRYFFHATEARLTDEDYQLDGDDENEENEGAQPAASPSQTAASNSPDEDEASNADEGAESKLEDMDSDMAEWFKVEENAAAESAQDDKDEGSVTEADSDNEDVGREDETNIDLEEWFKVKADIGDGDKSTGEDSKQEEVIITSRR